MPVKLHTATEDDARVVAQDIYRDMFMKIPNREAALDCAIIACEWISDSWVREGSPHFTATAKCWDKVKETLIKMKQ